MYVNFDDLSSNARLWVYQASRDFTDEEMTVLATKLEEFINQWTAHGKNLQASFTILYNRFIALAVDEEVHNATGCSIDSSVSFMKQLGQQLNIDLFDRSQIAFLANDAIKTESIVNFKNNVKAGKLVESTLLFNNAITVKGELDDQWLIRLDKSWAGKFLPSAAI